MPRVSVAAAEAPDATGASPRLIAPSFLTKAERRAFDQLISSVHPQHFTEADVPLIVAYLQAAQLARRSARKPDQVETWMQAVRMLAALARTLRLSPQSRMHPRTAGRQAASHHGGPRPWERET